VANRSTTSVTCSGASNARCGCMATSVAHGRQTSCIFMRVFRSSRSKSSFARQSSMSGLKILIDFVLVFFLPYFSSLLLFFPSFLPSFLPYFYFIYLYILIYFQKLRFSFKLFSQSVNICTSGNAQFSPTFTVVPTIQRGDGFESRHKILKGDKSCTRARIAIICRVAKMFHRKYKVELYM